MNPLAVSACPESATADRLSQRVQALVHFYQQVQAERMQGVALLNPVLQVEALGFVATGTPPDQAEGVLITPWFMSLLRLPLAWQDGAALVGYKQVHGFGHESFDFITAHDSGLGLHQSCALFSPMATFASQQQARDTAQAVLDQLRQGPEQAAPAAAAPAPPPAPMPARRAFFLARSALAGGPR